MHLTLMTLRYEILLGLCLLELRHNLSPSLSTVQLLYPPVLRNLFVPLFLLCWPARQALAAAIIQSASRQLGVTPRVFTLKAFALATFLLCFIFTW